MAETRKRRSVIDALSTGGYSLIRPRWSRKATMRHALALIEGVGCARSSSRGTYCWTRPDWSPTCSYAADKWCDSCIAAAGLRGTFQADGSDGERDDH